MAVAMNTNAWSSMEQLSSHYYAQCAVLAFFVNVYCKGKMSRASEV